MVVGDGVHQCMLLRALCNIWLCPVEPTYGVHQLLVLLLLDCCCRVTFSPDSSCIWALAVMPQEDPDSDATPTAQQPNGSSGGSSLFCFSVVDGSLLQQLPQPHGNAAVSSFALDAAGGVLATCGSDHLVKLWNVGPGQVQVVCQSFTAHHGAVAGRLVLGAFEFLERYYAGAANWLLMLAQPGQQTSMASIVDGKCCISTQAHRYQVLALLTRAVLYCAVLCCALQVLPSWASSC